MPNVPPLSQIVGDPYYHRQDFDTQMNILDTAETNHLDFVREQHTASPSKDPTDEMDYADYVQKHRSKVQNERFKAIGQETARRAAQVAGTLDVPFESIQAQLDNPNVKLDELPPDIRQLKEWQIGTVQQHGFKNSDKGYSPTSTAMIQNLQGQYMGDMNVYMEQNGKKTQPFAAVSFALDENGQQVPDDKRDKAIRIPLKKDIEEELKRLDKEIGKKTEERIALQKGQAVSSGGFSEEPYLAEQAKAGAQIPIDAKTKEIEELQDKRNRYRDPKNGMTEYMQDQVMDRIKNDKNLSKRFPHGANFVSRTIKDVGIGISQNTYNLGAAAAMTFGAKDTARSLAQKSADMDIVRAAEGFGHTRQHDTIAAQLLMVTSDQVPLLLGQMGVGFVASRVAARNIASILPKTALGVDMLATGGTAQVAKVSKYFGDKIGAAVATIPSSGIDAASNLASIYNEVDSLEAQAQFQTPQEAEASRKKAQEIEDNASSAFMAHFASTTLLEFMPIEKFLKRTDVDLSVAEKAVRKGVDPKMSAFERNVEAQRRATAMQGRVDSYLETKFPRLTAAVSQGRSEALTEMLQAVSDNVIAQNFYDENRDIFEGMTSGGIAGFYLGSVMGAIAHRAPKSAISSNVSNMAAAEGQAAEEAAKMNRSISGTALDNGTIAHPVREVVKQRETDGAWVVEDPDMPEDAESPPDFNTPEEATAWAETRWNRYWRKKEGDVMRQTGMSEDEVNAELNAMESLFSGTFGSVAPETIYKAKALTIRFQAEPDEATPSVPSELEELYAEMNTPTGQKLREEMDKFKEENAAWIAGGQQGPRPAPSAALGASLKAVKARKPTADVDKEGTTLYPNHDKAHGNILLDIKSKSVEWLKVDHGRRMGRIRKKAEAMEKAGGGTAEDKRRLADMILENELIAEEVDKREFGPQGTGATAPNAPQGSTQGTPVAGVVPPSSGQGNATGEATLGQGAIRPAKIISGGQTGGDMGGLLAGRDLGIETGGTAPKGYKTDTGSNPDLANFGLSESPSSNYVARTIDNVNNSDVTIAYLQGKSVGTGKTIGYAQTGKWQYGKNETNLKGHKPVIVVTTKDPDQAAEQIRQGIAQLGIENPVVNIAGHRESSVPGIEAFVRDSLSKAFSQPITAQATRPASEPVSTESEAKKRARERMKGYPKSVQQFLQELKVKIDTYNKALLGQEVDTTNSPESKPVKELIGMPPSTTPGVDVPMFDSVTGEINDAFIKLGVTKAPEGFETLEKQITSSPPATSKEISENKTSGATPSEPTPIVNRDGTVNIDQLLSSVPSDSPLGGIAELLQEIIPVIIPGDDRVHFSLSRNPTDKGVSNNTDQGKVVVGDGVGALDSIGVQTTTAELIGELLPRFVDVLTSDALDMMRNDIVGSRELGITPRAQLRRESPIDKIKAGPLSHEATSPSATEMRLAFDLAMPAATWDNDKKQSTVRTGDEMRRSLVRGEIAFQMGKLPSNNDILDAMADGTASVSPDEPMPDNPGDFHVQLTAAKEYIFWRKDFDNEWRTIEVDRTPMPKEQYFRDCFESKLACLYLRSVMAGGYFNDLFGHTSRVREGDRQVKMHREGLAGTALSKAEYQEKYGHLGKLAPPYELTSLNRFIAGMLSNPTFSIMQDKGGSWVAPMPVRKTVFNVTIVDLLGAGSKATQNSDNDMLVAAALLAANAKETRYNLLRGIPGPTPVRTPVSQHLARLEAGQNLTESHRGQRQDSRGVTPERVNESGETVDPQAPFDPESQERGITVPAQMRQNPASRQPTKEAEGEFTEEAGRAEINKQPAGRNPQNSPELEEALYDNGITQEDFDEVVSQMNSENTSFFAMQLQAMENMGMLASTIDETVDARIAQDVKATIPEKKLGIKIGDDFSGAVALQRVMMSTQVNKEDIDALLAKLAEYLPEDKVEEVGVKWHEFQLHNNKDFKAALKKHINKLYGMYRDRTKGRKITESEIAERRGALATVDKIIRSRITPTGFTPKFSITPMWERWSDKVDLEERSRPAAAGEPIIAAKNEDVTMVSVDEYWPDKEIRKYVYSLPKERQARVHNGLVHFAKAFGVKISDADTFENALGQLRIRPDSLGVWGTFEIILHGISTTKNPEALAEYFDKTLPDGLKKKTLKAAAKADPSMIRDMHAMATAFVDSIAFKLKEQGEMVIMLKDDPTITGTGEPISSDSEGIDQGDPGIREGEKDVSKEAQQQTKNNPAKPKELVGPFIAIPVNELMFDPANMRDETELLPHEPDHSKGVQGPKHKNKPERTQVKTGEAPNRKFKPGVKPRFHMRPSRFNPRGTSVSASYLNGVIPFMKNDKGKRPALTDSTPMSGLGGKSVREIFHRASNAVAANASFDELKAIYKDIWRQALTTTPDGMKILAEIAQEANATRKRTGQEAPLVSPETSDSQRLTPALAIAELINDYVPAPLQVEETAQEAEATLAQVLQDQMPKGGARRGQIGVASKMITVFKTGDASTFLHEAVHWMRLMKVEGGQSLFEIALGDHYAEFMRWATEDGMWDINDPKDEETIEERIALGAEEWMRRLESPKAMKRFREKLGDKATPRLLKAFKKVSNMFRRIYQGLKEIIPLDNRALAGYDSLFGAGTERITGTFGDEQLSDIDLAELDVTDAQIDKLQRDHLAATGQGLPRTLAQQVVQAEREMDGQELMPHPEPNMPRTPDDPTTMVWHQSLPSGWTPPASYTPQTQVGKLRGLYRNGVAWFQEWFLSTAGVDYQVFNIMKIKMAGARQTLERNILKRSDDLLTAIQKHLETSTNYGSQRGANREELHRRVNAYLIEKNPAQKAVLLAALPTDQIRRASAAMRAHVDNLSRILIRSGIVRGPLAATINNQKGFYLHRTYEITGDQKRAQRLLTGDLNLLWLAALDVIKTNRRYNDAQAHDLAMKILEAAEHPEIKMDKSDPRAKGVGVLMMANRTFDDVAEARDLLWGLREDPVLNYQNTVQQMSHLISTNLAMRELLRFGTTGPNPLIRPSSAPRHPGDVEMLNFFDDPNPGDFKKDPIGANIKTVLAGYKAPREVVTFVKEMLDTVENLNDVHRWWLQLMGTMNGAFKQANTVFNWRTALRNLYSSMMTVAANGHINPIHIKDASELVFKFNTGMRLTTSEEQLVQELMRNNILESATVAEIKDFYRHGFNLDKAYEGMLTFGPNAKKGAQARSEVARSLHNAWKGVSNFHFKFYNGCDTAAKVAAYLGEKARVKKAFPRFTDEQVREEAAKRTHMTMFSFDMTPKAINLFRRHIPITGPFVSFSWAMLRTSLNILNMGFTDFAQGMKRMNAGDKGGGWQFSQGLGRLASYAGIALASEMLAKHMMSIFGWDDEMMDKLRSFLPSYEQHATIIPVSDPLSDKIEYYNLSGVMPYSVVMDTVMAMFRGDKTVDKKLADAAFNFLAPFTQDQFIAQALRIIGDKRDPSGNLVTNESQDYLQKAGAIMTELMVPLIPGHFKNLARMDLIPHDQEWLAQQAGDLAHAFHIEPKDYTPWRKVEYAAGMTYNTINKKTMLEFKSTEWTEALRGAMRPFTSQMYSKNQISRDALEESLDQSLEIQKKVCEEANRLTQFMVFQLGFDDEEVNNVLKRASEREGPVTGGKMNADHRKAIDPFNTGIYEGGNQVSNESWNRMQERAEFHQPERALWMEIWKAEGRINNKPGR